MRRAGNIRTWLSLLVFVAIVALIEFVLIDYLAPRGLELKSQTVQIGTSQFSFPIVGLTFVGVLIVAVAAWTNMVGSMPIATLRDMSQLESIRILRAAAVSLFFFSALLFGPYLLGASEFLSQIMSLSRAVPQLTGALQGFYQLSEPTMGLDVLSKLAISQNIAAAALVVVSGLISHSQRRIKRAK